MEFTAPTDGILLDLIFERSGFAAKSPIRKLIKTGKCKIDDEIVKMPNVAIKQGQNIQVNFEKKALVVRKNVPFPYPLLYEDDAILAFEKPAGVPSASADRKLKTAFTNVLVWYKGEYGADRNLYFINKIDKKESGVMLLAKGSDNRVKLDEQWENMQRKYYALIAGKPQKEDGKAKHNLLKNTIGLWNAVGENAKAITSRLVYRTMKASGSYTLLKVEIDTDHKNILRAQLAAMGHPVHGDQRYKAPERWPRIGLHLFSIGLKHPETGADVVIKTPVPRDFMKLVKRNSAG